LYGNFEEGDQKIFVMKYSAAPDCTITFSNERCDIEVKNFIEAVEHIEAIIKQDIEEALNYMPYLAVHTVFFHPIGEMCEENSPSQWVWELYNDLIITKKEAKMLQCFHKGRNGVTHKGKREILNEDLEEYLRLCRMVLVRVLRVRFEIEFSD